MTDLKIRVLAVVCQLNRGGLESRLMDIIRNLDFNRVQIDIYTYRLEEGVLDEEAKSYGCKIYYNKPLTPKNMLWYVNYFSAFLNKHPEYHIVHAHQDAWCSVFCKGAQKAGVPVRIAHSRTAISTFSMENMVKNIIKMPARRYATHLWAVSKVAGKWLFGEKNMLTGKVEIWPNAIECKKYMFSEDKREEKRRDLGIDNKLVLIHVGNFTPPKNHEKVIRIFKEVTKRREDTVLLLAGTGENGHIKQLVEELDISNKVVFLGSRNDVNELLWAADVFLFPSLFEGLPGAVIEAQAAGLPCVISDTITEEVCITPIVTQLSLNSGAEDWAGSVLKIAEKGRTDTTKIMQDSGYDVESLVIELMHFYENVL